MKARITHAVETAICVDTTPIIADTAILQTFINVSALCPGECALIARSALTGVGTLVIYTLSTSTRVFFTFINIDALPTQVQLESFVALTPVAPRSWNTASVLTEISK